ncbi:hypothetical protein GIB67_037129 [Kingdonia uniflora]|uniref:NADH:quinone oxidoreductase/Mrp antiporter transmembrane domain-containing protein n=1 Tax=Kingdonia uniflora TaxID=39325 RepID=A0A7J7LHR7_9MAGN|nr:hypothetical protein GIB67_037129 [Kingdonia uniflora]
MYNSLGFSIALIFITVGIGFKSPAPSHQWTPNVYEGHDIGKSHCYYSNKHAIIGIIIGDSNDGYASMITYMMFYILMNLGTFAWIVSFGLRTGTDNIQDYKRLYMKDPFLAISLALCLLSLGGIPPLADFFGKLHLLWCGWLKGLYLLVLIGLLTSIVSIYYYLKIIKLLITGRNHEITPHVQNNRRSPLRYVPLFKLNIQASGLKFKPDAWNSSMRFKY